MHMEVTADFLFPFNTEIVLSIVEVLKLPCVAPPPPPQKKNLMTAL